MTNQERSRAARARAEESSRADPSAREDENRALAVAAVNEFIEALLAEDTSAPR